MQFLTRWGPGAALVLVALSQLYLTRGGVLTPSKGGGFGMFSVTDIRATRVASAQAVTPGGEACFIFLAAAPDTALADRLIRFLSYPEAADPARIVALLQRLKFVRVDLAELARDAGVRRERLALAPPEYAEAPLYRLAKAHEQEQSVSLSSIRLLLWRLRFSGGRSTAAGPRFRVELLRGPGEGGSW